MKDFIIDFGKTDLLILLAMLPAIIFGFVIYKKDVVEKEPLKLLIKLFIFGILSAGVALLIEVYAENIFTFASKENIIGIAFKSFLIIGLVEEGVKWLFTYFLCWHQKEFNYNYDAIVYMAFISLGFATIENIFAVLANKWDFLFILQRGLITVPAHVFFAILSGYYLGRAKKYYNRNWRNKAKKQLFLSVLLPVIAHGLFDFLLFMSNRIGFLFAFIFIIYLYISSFMKINKVSKEKNPLIKE